LVAIRIALLLAAPHYFVMVPCESGKRASYEFRRMWEEASTVFSK